MSNYFISLPVFHFEFLRVVNSSIAVHQHHGGGEVEEAGGEDQHLHGLVVRLAHGEGGHGEVEAAPEEDDDGVEAEGGGPAEQDVEQRHAGREHRGVQVRVHLRQVALHRDQNQAAAGGSVSPSVDWGR